MRNILLIAALLVACATLTFASTPTAELFVEVGTGACNFGVNCELITYADDPGAYSTFAGATVLTSNSSNILSSGWGLEFTGSSYTPNDTDPPVTYGLDVQNLAVTCEGSPAVCGTTPVTVAFSDTGFTTGIGGVTNAYSDTQSGPGFTTQTAIVDTGDNFFGDTSSPTRKSDIGDAGSATSTADVSLGSVNNVSNKAYSGTNGALVTAGPSAYSLTLLDTFGDANDANGSQVPLSYNTAGSILGVPEPTSITLLGSVLFLSALGLRRRLSKRIL